MANHVDIFEFCLFYVCAFTALFSTTPLGTFPPRPIIFSTPVLSLAGITIADSMTFNIPWIQFLFIMGTMGLVLIVVITLISNLSFSILGSGVSWHIDAKYLSTIIIGFVGGGGLGVSMSQMMPSDMPLLVSFFLVWIWVIVLIYSVIMYAGAGSTGT